MTELLKTTSTMDLLYWIDTVFVDSEVMVLMRSVVVTAGSLGLCTSITVATPPDTLIVKTVCYWV